MPTAWTVVVLSETSLLPARRDDGDHDAAPGRRRTRRRIALWTTSWGFAPSAQYLAGQVNACVGRWNAERGAQFQGDAMDHNPKTCTICRRTDRIQFDAESRFHFVPHDSKAAFPLFRLYPAVQKSA
jgi:hypothetical protein